MIKKRKGVPFLERETKILVMEYIPYPNKKFKVLRIGDRVYPSIEEYSEKIPNLNTVHSVTVEGWEKFCKQYPKKTSPWDYFGYSNINGWNIGQGKIKDAKCFQTAKWLPAQSEDADKLNQDIKAICRIIFNKEDGLTDLGKLNLLRRFFSNYYNAGELKKFEDYSNDLIREDKDFIVDMLLDIYHFGPLGYRSRTWEILNDLRTRQPEQYKEKITQGLRKSYPNSDLFIHAQKDGNEYRWKAFTILLCIISVTSIWVLSNFSSKVNTLLDFLMH